MPRKDDKQLHRAFYPIRRRIMGQHFIDVLLWGLVAMIGQSLIWLVVSFFVPIFHIVSKMLYTGSFIILITLILAWIKKPSIYEMAGKADRLGLEDRVTTAYELRGFDDEFAKLQRQDTLEKLKAFDPKTLSIVIPKKSGIIAVTMALVLFIGFMIPNPQDKVIRERLMAKKIIEDQHERLEKDGAEGLSKAGLTKEEQEEIKKLLADLSTKLSKSQEYRDAIKEISKTEEKIAEKIKEARQEKMAGLGEELSKQKALRPLGERIKNTDTEGIKEEIEKLQELAKADELDRDAIKAMKKALDEMARNLGEGKTKEEFTSIANEIGKNLDHDSNNLDETLGVLGTGLTDMSESPLTDVQELIYTLQDMKNKISQSENHSDGSKLAQSVESGDQSSEANKSQNKTEGNQGQAGQNHSSQGNQGGQGNSGQGGQGNQGASGSGTAGGQGSGIGNSHSEYEKILNPERLGDGGKISQVKGNLSDQGSSQQVEAGEGLGSFDGFIPYNEVFGEYKSQAMQNIERINIPVNMKEWVKGYFSSLE